VFFSVQLQVSRAASKVRSDYNNGYEGLPALNAPVYKLTLRILHRDCWASEIGARFPDLRFFLRNTVPTGSEAMDILYVRGPTHGPRDFSAVLDFLKGHPRIRGVEVLDQGDDSLFALVKSSHEKSIINAISRMGVFVLKPTLLVGDREVWTLGMVRRETAQDLVRSLNEAGDVEVLSLVKEEFDTLHLTPMQRTALDTAFAHGYYAFPRQITPTELAKKMGLAKSTYLEHLRKAEQKILHSYFESF